MAGIGRTIRTALALVAVAAVAACASLVPDTAARLRNLDPRYDDLASLVVLFDLPQVVAPIPTRSVLRVSLRSVDGSRDVNAQLLRADMDMIGGMPPPGPGRGYFVFAFSERDKMNLRNAQAALLADPSGTASVTIEPVLCRLVEEINPEELTFSVSVALPGGPGLEPLIVNETLGNALRRTNGTLPSCSAVADSRPAAASSDPLAPFLQSQGF